MKKLYVRLTLTLFLLIFISTSVAALAGGLISNMLPSEPTHDAFGRNNSVMMQLRGLLVPILTILSFSFSSSVMTKKVVAPIVALSKATHEIAKGDFDIQVKETKRKDEIGDLERSFNLMAKELKSSEFMRKDFISNVSHEFKTPLSIIKGYGALLADDGLPPQERRQYARMIEHESDRLIALTGNILRLSKLDNQAIQTNNAPFSLDEQIRQAALAMQPAWSARSIEWDIDLQPCDFVGDEELLSHVWLNLLDNAVKFSPEGGVVSVTMRREEGGVYVDVADQGDGMDEDTMARIFDQFYQGDTSLAKEGSGLGLSIVKRIVDIYHGSIEVRSKPGQGTRFGVRLPTHDGSKR